MADMLREGWGAGTIFKQATVDGITAALVEAIDARAALSLQAGAPPPPGGRPIR